MELHLFRTYYPEGTNGVIRIDAEFVCYSIELPQRQNKENISCIPEGRYGLHKRYSEKLGWHFEVLDVPNRSLILMHPANDALQELKGCIAPVNFLTGEGKGDSSVAALTKLKRLLYPLLQEGTPVWLNIQEAATTTESNQSNHHLNFRHDHH
jgi:hypothetical protein